MEVVYVPGIEVLERDEGLELAAAWLRSQKARRSDVVIVLPVRGSAEHAEALLRRVPEYRVETSRTIHAAAPARGIVVAVWPREDTLAEIARFGPRGVCVVQWMPEHTKDWLAAHSARDLSGRGPALSKATISDPVVREALEDLTRSVNLGTALAQIEDRDSAILTLHLLHDRGHGLEPDELYRFAIAAGWNARGAKRLREIASEVLDGRQHRTHTLRRYGDDVYRYWQNEAAKKK